MKYNNIEIFFKSSQTRIIADVTARVWSALLSFSVLPIYLSYIGSESLGLVTAFATIQTVLGLLDFSLSPSLTRELAQVSSSAEGWARVKNLSRTLEIIYIILAILIGVFLIVFIPTISKEWLNPQALTSDEIQLALYVGVLMLICQWPATLYAGGLAGFEKQHILALINITIPTLRVIITIFCFLLFNPSVLTIFIVGLLASLFQTFLMRFVFWKMFPKCTLQGVFQLKLISEIWRFTIGLSFISITSILIWQADKIIFSKLLPLSEFGTYSISLTIANVFFIISGSFYGVSYPRFSNLVKNNDEKKLADFYHKISQTLAILVFPGSAIVFFFSQELLVLWTGNLNLANEGHIALSFYVIGNLLNCIISLPYAVQLAIGSTRALSIAHLVCLALIYPFIYLLFPILGILSGPANWIFINLILLIITAYIANSKFSRNDKRKWYLFDISLPLVVSYSSIFVFRLLPLEYNTRSYIFLHIMLALVFGVCATLLVCSRIRKIIFEFIYLKLKKGLI